MIVQAFIRQAIGAGTVTSVTATNASITIGGTATNPTVGLPYKVYTALITQTGSNAPVATVLANTTGETYTWNYLGVGNYRMVVNGGNTPFIVNKTFILLGLGAISAAADPYTFYYDPFISTTNSIVFFVNDKNGMDDGVLNNASLEIRVYP